MYINPFLAGILSTLWVETALFIGVVLYFNNKKNKE